MLQHALNGVRVVELAWVIAGPLTAKHLASFGAEVIKVESAKRVDASRLTAPFKDGIMDPDRSALFGYTNAGKYSLALDLTSPRGLEVAKRLISKSDVVVENFRPGVIDKMGLGYDELRRIKPDIIMVSISILGKHGAYENFAGFGPHGAAVSGYLELTGWPDRDPTGFFGGATPGDQIVETFAVLATMAALHRRHRTGQGEYIEVTQSEVFVNLLATAYLACAVTGQEPTRMGNRDPRAAPHGAFRCKGKDNWCTIAIFGEQEWKTFCDVMGNPSWTRDAKFATVAARKQNEEELERLVEEWTVRLSSDEVVALLQDAGCKAGAVRTMDYLLESDPHLRARGYFVPVNHPKLGTLRYALPPSRLSLTPAEVRRPPCLGEHNEYVCCRIIGMSDEEFVELMAEGVLQ